MHKFTVFFKRETSTRTWLGGLFKSKVSSQNILPKMAKKSNQKHQPGMVGEHLC